MNEEELRKLFIAMDGKELLAYIIDNFLQHEIEFLNFEEALLCEQRFFPSSTQTYYLKEFLESIPLKALATTVDTEEFFRARFLDEKFTEEHMPKFYPLQTSFAECCIKLNDAIPDIPKGADKTLKDKTFRGMSKEESGAPPAHLVKDGRLNPVNIPFLYTAKEKETAIQEIRPQIGQTVSVATLQTVKPLKILDLTVPVEGTASYFGYHPKTFFEVVSEAFRRPNHDDPKKYLITQYLTEYIRVELKVDGICFWSSLRKGGKNVVFFDTEACVPVSSDLITVEDIQFKLKGFYGEEKN